jgi:hypothetical protein
VASRARAKAQLEWKNVVVVAKQCPPFPKPVLVKLASEQLLKVLGLNVWGVGNVPRDAASRMEKDEDLQGMIQSTRCVYARQLKTTWDVKIGIESPIKQVGQNNWQMLWIFMNLE